MGNRQGFGDADGGSGLIGHGEERSMTLSVGLSTLLKSVGGDHGNAKTAKGDEASVHIP